MRILLLGDVHLSHENIKKLKEWIKARKIGIHLTLITGDVCNIDHELGQGSNETKAFLSTLEEFSKCSLFGSRILFVPGNHDPKEVFTAGAGTGNDRVESLHGTFTIINHEGAELEIVGLGGSTPGIFKDREVMAFAGYPYGNDGDLKSSLTAMQKEKRKQFILLTHMGPFTSSTTVKTMNGRSVEMGSKAILEYLKSEGKSSILLHIHGHSHEGWGVCQLESGIPIVNPGALKDGRFACVEISYSADMEWKIDAIQLYLL